MTPMRRGGQDRLGHHDHSCLTTFTSHLEAVGSSALLDAHLPDCREIHAANGTKKRDSRRLELYFPCL